jgi:hypothetical protein
MENTFVVPPSGGLGSLNSYCLKAELQTFSGELSGRIAMPGIDGKRMKSRLQAAAFTIYGMDYI